MTINLRKLFGLCEHKYIIFDTVLITQFHKDTIGNRIKDSEYIIGKKFYQKCEKCGKIIITTSTI
jgi:chemotaxis signal transduction protein